MFYGLGIEDYAQEAYEQPSKRETRVDGRRYNPNLSTEDIAVYENGGDKRVVVAMRGTSKLSDLNPDVGIAINRYKHTNRYRSDKEQLQKIIDKYGKENIRLTGHSLGGKSASTLGKEYGIQTDSFSTGATPIQMGGDIVNRIGCMISPNRTECQNSKNITHHIIGNDPISLWNMFKPNVIYHKQKKLNPHALSNFDNIA